MNRHAVPVPETPHDRRIGPSVPLLAALLAAVLAFPLGAAYGQSPALPASAPPAPVQPPPPPDEPAAESFEALVDGLEARPGLLDVFVDHAAGRVLLALPAPDDRGLRGRFIHQAYLRRGVGSNPLGLDRSYGGDSQLVAFRQVGQRVYLEAENWRFQARGGSEAELRAVRDSFAGSVLWGTELLATAEDGRALIDLGGFLLRDAIGVAARVKATGQGTLKLDADRSFVEAAATLVFPDNLEAEATLTFSAAEPGRELRATAPEPEAVTVVQHHSFVRLPEPGFEPRSADPRVGSINHLIHDYAAPLDAPLVRRFAMRHRLEKTDATAARSPVKEPIVYYLDAGAPEPIRSALLDGARWWAEAFEAAGFEDAYRVELLPEGAHPLDARYNVISWVHRATRGWSYGASVSDPRTGEIIKGYVLLGSQRVRQDRLIFEGLFGRALTGTGEANDPLALSLARIRQLAAHEVGHTLGLQHNFAASAAGRASVMDYPAPLVSVDEDGRLDGSAAYGVGIAPWDRFTIAWIYRQFPPGTDTAAALSGMIEAASPAERLFITDAHGRGVGTAHPQAAVWDNGSDPVLALQGIGDVRARALDRFGVDRLAAGQDVGQLQRVLVPIYLFHRYQVAAAAKLVGGADYAYGVAGDGGASLSWVPAERQLAALQVLLNTIHPAFLDLPDALLDQLTPFSEGFRSDTVTERELFASATAPLFDLQSAAGAAARLTLGAILHPARLARLSEQHRRDPGLPGIEQVLGLVLETIFEGDRANPRQAELRRIVQRTAVESLLAVAADPKASPAVAQQVEALLEALQGGLAHSRPADDQQRHEAVLARRIDRFLERGETAGAPQRAPSPPPGSPIGQDAMGWSPDGSPSLPGPLPGPMGQAESCWHCDPLSF